MATDDLLLQAAHLLRRAGFGGTPADIAAAADRGLAETVDAMLAGLDSSPPPLIDPSQVADYMGKMPTKHLNDQQVLWLERMLGTRSPLQEKLTLLWHNHFATANYKVNHPLLMARQNDVLRRLGFGAFGDLLLAMSKDPAMIIWLDNNANHKRAPNENYAREVMELFTLGIGNYSEDDVHAGARAFTGWHEKDGEFVFNDHDHDHTTKTYLGQTGDLGGEDVVAILAAHDATARNISSKLWRWFAYSGPEPSVVADLAAAYTSTNGDITAVLRTLFNHPAFYSDRALSSQVKNPAEFVVQAHKVLGVPASGAAVNAMRSMGMELFNPPNVAGWPGGLAWVNAATLLARFNYANRLVGAVGRPEADDDVNLNQLAELLQYDAPDQMVSHWLARLGQQKLSENSQQAVLEYLGDPPATVKQLVAKHRACLHAVLSSPEFQLN